VPVRNGLLRAVVADYLSYVATSADAELAFFQSLPSLEDAIRTAALAQRPDGKRLSHQRRIPRAALEESARRLLARRRQIARARSFDKLHSLIELTVGSIPSIGRLTIYDTALRIGAKIGLWPQRVYLHAGTRVGASRLGLNAADGTLSPSSLPAPFQDLEPRQIEDVLCIYKDDFLRTKVRRQRDPCGPRRRSPC
jgi:hypothetical protein